VRRIRSTLTGSWPWNYATSPRIPLAANRPCRDRLLVRVVRTVRELGGEFVREPLQKIEGLWVLGRDLVCGSAFECVLKEAAPKFPSEKGGPFRA
jgi:hypothetical protein